MNDQDLMPERLGEYRLLDRIGEGGKIGRAACRERV